MHARDKFVKLPFKENPFSQFSSPNKHFQLFPKENVHRPSENSHMQDRSSATFWKVDCNLRQDPILHKTFIISGAAKVRLVDMPRLGEPVCAANISDAF